MNLDAPAGGWRLTVTVTGNGVWRLSSITLAARATIADAGNPVAPPLIERICKFVGAGIFSDCPNTETVETMCGIAGIRRFDGKPVERAHIARMVADLHHRGPDESGTWVAGSVGLGHARLSIIDVQGSRQPMADLDGLAHLVFNGEILNYRELRAGLDYPFRTKGDTEVILALYSKHGPRAVRQLRGQFAHAIHDTRTGETHLFRDRFGVLPLYYYAGTDFFAFASEIKALLPLIPSCQVDEESLHDYLTHRVVPAPYTLIKGIRKLMPGHHLTVMPDGICASTPYWELPNNPSESAASPEEAIKLVDRALSDSVREALIADVPVGVYLSGGVDSSLLTAMAAQHELQTLHTFSASFGQHPLDESNWARKVSRIFDTTHHEVAVTPDDFQRNWSRLSWYRDGPLSEPADVAINSLAALARERVKVVLSGEGSDELFGGYPKYRYAVPTRWAGGWATSKLLNAIQRPLPASLSRLRIAVRALSEPTYEERMRAWFAPFTTAERAMLLGGPAQRAVIAPYAQGRGDAVRRMLYADMFAWLSDNLLERADRMSMAESLETRPPFLDYRLVELAFSLPSSLKVRPRTTKWVLKQVALEYLPSEIVNRRKIGFKVPLDAWFRGDLRDFAHDQLCGPSSFVGSTFSPADVRRLLEDHWNGRRNEENRIWTLLSLEVWFREMVSRRHLRPTRP